MIRSMTGFARRERQGPWGTLACEIRSVNHRYLELSLRLPDDLRGLEGDLALAGQCDTTLEGLEGLLERQLAALQSLDQGLEFSQGSFEIGGAFAAGHALTYTTANKPAASAASVG